MNEKIDSAALHPGLMIPFEDAWRFILKLGIAAHKYGSTADRIESFLVNLSKFFGYEGVFKSPPSEIMFALRESPDAPQRLEVVSTPSPDVNLDRLARLGDLLHEYKAGNLPIEEASLCIDRIDDAPLPWGNLVTLMGYAFVGGGLAPLLGGGWPDTLLATAFSIMVYGMVVLSGRWGAAAREWLPFSSACVVALLATALKCRIPQLNLVLVILSSVAILLPGYTISLGAGELAGQYVVSGAANLMRGLICLMKQIAGGWLGILTGSAFVAWPATGPAIPVGAGWLCLLFPLLLIGLCLTFQTARRDLPWAFLVSGVAYLGVLAGSHFLNSDFGNLVGTVVAVMIANIWARRTGRPTAIVIIPAIVMLVSGSIGFRGLAAMAGGELALGMQQFLHMFVVALTVFAGILIGHTLVRPEPGL